MSGHHHPSSGEASGRIRAAFFLNLSFTIIEVIGGVLVGSVAIVADAVHDLGDTVSLGVALVLEKYAQKRPDRQFSYGYRRISALSALITGAVLLLGSVYIAVEAVQRFAEPLEPHGGAMLGLAVFGVAVNGFAAWKLSKGFTQNERMLTWHLLEDVLGWAAVLVGSILIVLFDWVWIDPALAIGIALFILWNVFRNVTKTGLLFLQQVPVGLDLDKLKQKLTQLDEVLDVHDIHAWSLDGERHVLSCHIVVDDEAKLDQIKSAARNVIRVEGEFHVTIELEFDTEPCPEQCDRDIPERTRGANHD